jgi:hypothetical protein
MLPSWDEEAFITLADVRRSEWARGGNHKLVHARDTLIQE